MEALAVATQLAETKFLADHDPLTRLLNRRALLHRLAASESLGPHPLALVFLDLDNFKEVNDGHGHAVGDRILARFSALLAELVPDGGLAFRVGGDEFALLFADAGEQEARDLIGRVRVALEGNIDPLLRSLIASFGIATNSSGRSAHELLQVADEAMYAAKRTGTGIEVAA
jgi:diguanylate cyclase (GGDEF)-like protein